MCFIRNLLLKSWYTLNSFKKEVNSVTENIDIEKDIVDKKDIKEESNEKNE